MVDNVAGKLRDKDINNDKNRVSEVLNIKQLILLEVRKRRFYNRW